MPATKSALGGSQSAVPAAKSTLVSLDVAKHSGFKNTLFFTFIFCVFNMFLFLFLQSGVFWFMIFL